MIKNPFARINATIKTKKDPEKRLIRHAKEREIIEFTLERLKDSEHGRLLLDFIEAQNVKINVLRGQMARDYAAQHNNVYIAVPDKMKIDDPDILIHLVGSLREAMQEYEPHLKRPDINKGESFFVHRMEQKLLDKLFCQTAVVYELGKIKGFNEYIDSFATMGYYNLIDNYEKDLTESS